MSLEEQYQEWRSLLQQEQLKFLGLAEKFLLEAEIKDRQHPSEVTEKLLEHAREHLETQKQLAHEASCELELIIKGKMESDRPSP